MTIQDKVAEKIAQSGPQVMERVVSILADKEVKSRVDMVAQAVSTLDGLNKDLAKVNRNDETRYVDGLKVESMSEKRFNEIKKLKDRITKLEQSLNAALEKNTQDEYAKLSKAISGKSPEPQKDGDGEGGEQA